MGKTKGFTVSENIGDHPTKGQKFGTDIFGLPAAKKAAAKLARDNKGKEGYKAIVEEVFAADDGNDCVIASNALSYFISPNTGKLTMKRVSASKG